MSTQEEIKKEVTQQAEAFAKAMAEGDIKAAEKAKARLDQLKPTRLSKKILSRRILILIIIGFLVFAIGMAIVTHFQ